MADAIPVMEPRSEARALTGLSFCSYKGGANLLVRLVTPSTSSIWMRELWLAMLISLLEGWSTEASAADF